MKFENPGDCLKALRNALGLTQEQFGEECGVGRTTIGELEQLKDAHDIHRAKSQRSNTISKIAQALGIERDSLVTYLGGDIDLESIKRQQNRTGVNSRLQFTLPKPARKLWLAVGAVVLVVFCVLSVGAIAMRRSSTNQDIEPKSIRQHERPSDDQPANNPAESHPREQNKVFQESPASRDIPNKSSSQWPELKSLNQLHSIHVADSNTAWVTGLDGVIIATRNGFKDWEIQESGTKVDLQSVVFREDGKTGWLVGGQGTILHTTNGGQIWSPQKSGTNESLRGLHFAKDWRTAWAVGSNGTILHTTDAGQTWQLRPESKKAFGYANFVFFMDDNRGWIGGQHGHLLMTDDGGKNWHTKLLSVKHRRLWGFHFDERGGWVVADDGEIFKSRDGKTWELLSEPVLTGAVIDVQFIDSQNGWIVGHAVILRTRDGGEKWVRELHPTYVELNSIHMIDDQVGWAVGLRTDSRRALILRHTENGWKPIE